jgi:hypothetical protein
MKLTILVPSQSYMASAGARIRYRRLASHLSDSEVELSLEEVRGFDPASADCDVLLVSKCYDARALVVAAALSRRQKLVGVDLFDDYFSATEDARLLRHRSWLAQIVGFCDFAVCSTQTMASVVKGYDCGLSIHLLNDPARELDPDTIGPAVTKKIARAHADGVMRVGWFGVGDNPYFAVGLMDISAHAAMLAELARSAMSTELTILTNRRALTGEGLSLIEQLPVSKKVVEWSEAAERELLEEALTIFLPVSAESFSMAKSLNRAVSALSSGCQVLSAGYPLYSALEPLLYRSVGDFVDDLAQGALRLSAETMDCYRQIMQRVASPKNEARRFARFLFGLKVRPAPRLLPIALIHGHSSHPDSHRLVQEAQGFSVASPYCSTALDFDVLFRGIGALRMFISRETAARLLPSMRSRLRRIEGVAIKGYLELPEKVDQSPSKFAGAIDCALADIPFQLATYESAIGHIQRRMTEAFGDCRTVISERSPLPFPLVSWPRATHDG